MNTPKDNLVEATRAEEAEINARRMAQEKQAEAARKSFLGRALAHESLAAYRAGQTLTVGDKFERKVPRGPKARHRAQRFTQSLGLGNDFDVRRLALRVQPEPEYGGHFVIDYRSSVGARTAIDEFKAYKDSAIGVRPEDLSETNLYVFGEKPNHLEPVSFGSEHYKFIREAAVLFIPSLLRKLERSGA